jgi:hypothetical protein
MKYIDFFRLDITGKILGESYDIFVSAYNNNERVGNIYNEINATHKYYLLSFPFRKFSILMFIILHRLRINESNFVQF